jgi:hypothetical protein
MVVVGTFCIKSSSREIERNDELYIGSDMEEWIQDCRTQMIENLTLTD